MSDLETLIDRYGGNAETLRHIAYEHCDIPRGFLTPIVDGWLYSRLGLAATLMGPHFSLGSTADVLLAISYPLDREHGSFIEKCRHSWAEYLANPFVHDVRLPDQPLSFHSEEPVASPHESHGDVMSNWLRSRPSDD